MNAAEHRLASGFALAALGAALGPRPEERIGHAIIGCIGGSSFALLPDLIEPATHPHHRQFFHSLVFAGALGYGVYRLYHWTPESDFGSLMRLLGLVGGGAYLVHLALDATTKRSLPFLGKL